MVDLPEWAAWARQATFDACVGGFLEVTNPYQSYIYYGKVSAATLSDTGQLRVEFEWQAIGVDEQNCRSREHKGGWVAVDEDYEVTIFRLPDDEIPDDYVRVYFERISSEGHPLQLFGGPIFEDVLTFYPPGSPERVKPEKIRPADPAKPVDVTPRYITPPGGSWLTMWDVGPDGKQFQIKL